MPLETRTAPLPGQRPPGSGEVRRVLDTARSHLGMEAAWLAHLGPQGFALRAVSGDLGGHAAGDVLETGRAYCHRVLRGEVPAAVREARYDLGSEDLAVMAYLGVGSYVSAPVRDAHGSTVGLLACLSPAAHPEIDDRTAGFLSAFAELLRDELPGPSLAEEGIARVRQHLAPGGMRSVYQPVVRLDSGEVVGQEALTRFADPGVLNPALAFKEAADVGLGTELELAAVSLALEGRTAMDGEQWLSLNLSPSALLDPRALELLSLHADDRLVVELTEHAAVEDYSLLAARTKELSDLGLGIAVDDAGAGFASLRHILRLAPGIIKLDIEITRGIDLDPVRQALASSLIAFARTTGAVLLAEGVEEVGEAETLLDLGVELAQGYLFGRPAPLP